MFKSLELKRTDYLFIILLMFAELTRSAFFLTFWPLYAVNVLEFSLLTAGLVVSVHYLTETLFKITAGSHLDRYGRPVLVLGLMISLLSLVGIYVSRTEVSIVILAALFGLGFAPIWLAVISNVAPINIANRAGRMGLVFSAWLLGAGAGPVSINFLIPSGYHLAFKLLILFWVVCVLMVIFIPMKAQTKYVRIPLIAQVKKILGDQAVVRILLPGMFLQTMAASLLLPILPIYATKYLGLTSHQYGLLLIAGGAATVGFLVPMGKLVDRLPLKNVLTTGFLLSACFLAMVPLASSLFWVITLVMLVGTSYALLLPAWNTLLARAIPQERQATGWGVFSTLEGLGIAAGPILGALVAGSLHPAGAIYLSAIILGIMGIFYLYYP